MKFNYSFESFTLRHRNDAHGILVTTSKEHEVEKLELVAKWNLEVWERWCNKDQSQTHDCSALHHYPLSKRNSDGLVVTEDGNLVFGENKNLALVIRGDDGSQLVTCKYRLLFDIYLLYESAGYSIEEVPIDECSAHVTVPNLTRPQILKASTNLQDLQLEEDLSEHRIQVRKKKHKNRNCASLIKQNKLLKGLTYKKTHKMQCKQRQFDRDFKDSEHHLNTISAADNEDYDTLEHIYYHDYCWKKWGRYDHNLYDVNSFDGSGAEDLEEDEEDF